MSERNLESNGPKSSPELLLEMVEDQRFGITELIKYFNDLEKINPTEAYNLYRDFLPKLEQRVNQIAPDQEIDKDYRVAMINLLATVQDKVKIGVEGGMVPALKIEPEPTAMLKTPYTGKLTMSDVEEIQKGDGKNSNGKGATTSNL
jgi:hypothetical protein